MPNLKGKSLNMTTIQRTTMLKLRWISVNGARSMDIIRGTVQTFWRAFWRGEDFITFIDESLYLSYAKSTWWIDSGVTIHIANSLQGFHTRRTLQRGERKIKVANGVQAEVEAITDLSLELDDGFVLQLSDVLYVPSLRRNLISVSRLDDDGYDCHFGNGKCQIVFNNKCVGLASDKTSFICHFLRMWMLWALIMRMPPRLWMQEISGREFMMYHQNYSTAV